MIRFNRATCSTSRSPRYDQALTLSVDGERIATIYAVRNPDKLGAFLH